MLIPSAGFASTRFLSALKSLESWPAAETPQTPQAPQAPDPHDRIAPGGERPRGHDANAPARPRPKGASLRKSQLSSPRAAPPHDTPVAAGPTALAAVARACTPQQEAQKAQEAEDTAWTARLLTPWRQTAIRSLTARMTAPTGVKGWLRRVFGPKHRAVEPLAMSLVAPVLDELPKHWAAARRREVGARLCGDWMQAAFDGLDDAGRRRWARRVSGGDGSFQDTLKRHEQLCAGITEQNACWRGNERLLVTLQVLGAMRDTASSTGR